MNNQSRPEWMNDIRLALTGGVNTGTVADAWENLFGEPIPDDELDSYSDERGSWTLFPGGRIIHHDSENGHIYVRPIATPQSEIEPGVYRTGLTAEQTSKVGRLIVHLPSTSRLIVPR